jgi:hypothetical protein
VISLRVITAALTRSYCGFDLIDLGDVDDLVRTGAADAKHRSLKKARSVRDSNAAPEQAGFKRPNTKSVQPALTALS